MVTAPSGLPSNLNLFLKYRSFLICLGAFLFSNKKSQAAVNRHLDFLFEDFCISPILPKTGFALSGIYGMNLSISNFDCENDKDIPEKTNPVNNEYIFIILRQKSCYKMLVGIVSPSIQK
jgi:hypothetical protein